MTTLNQQRNIRTRHRQKYKNVRHEYTISEMQRNTTSQRKNADKQTTQQIAQKTEQALSRDQLSYFLAFPAERYEVIIALTLEHF
mmetsp:Transcript_38778/g.61881  ORF Transcript_38778/g.61881 Transcript_38778/m.61881 type:complete len:85 (-) Transcript_38778:195-449(-)